MAYTRGVLDYLPASVIPNHDVNKLSVDFKLQCAMCSQEQIMTLGDEEACAAWQYFSGAAEPRKPTARSEAREQPADGDHRNPNKFGKLSDIKFGNSPAGSEGAQKRAVAAAVGRAFAAMPVNSTQELHGMDDEVVFD